MSRRTITIEESSPVIAYSPPGAWGEGIAFVEQYSNNAFRLTSVVNASASFQFNGTGVWVHGGRRNNHGPYLASIDGNTTTLNGWVNATIDVDSSPLFSAQNLNPGLHTVTLTNVPTNASEPYLSIDYILLEIGVPDQTTRSVDDSEPSVLYTPPAEWVNNNCTDIMQYTSYTCHSTASNLGAIQFTFQGDTIAVLGGVGPNYGSYNVSVDGESRGQYSAKWERHHSQQLLYIASGLGSGNHTLEIQSKPQVVGNILDIDQIQVFGGNATAFNMPSQASSSSKKTSLAGPIAGAVAGAVVLAVIAVVAIIFYRRRRRHSVKALDLSQDDNPMATQMQDIVPDPYVQPTVTGVTVYPSYPPSSSQWSFHQSPSTTNLMESVIEPDIDSHSGPQMNPTPIAIGGAGTEKSRYYPRDPPDGIEPPPYHSGHS
ncbi:hypothetical protein FRB99_006631 [Tulasnella sp. 403]|nr:hypothetical protein FRB99_006631 [Tulasnella sp. 403]